MKKPKKPVYVWVTRFKSGDLPHLWFFKPDPLYKAGVFYGWSGDLRNEYLFLNCLVKDYPAQIKRYRLVEDPE